MTEPATFVARAHHLADELDSARRYGVPIPDYITISAGPFGGVHMHLTAHEFAAWVDYTDATVGEYDHDGSHWRRAEVDVNGLRFTFAMATPLTQDGAA